MRWPGSLHEPHAQRPPPPCRRRSPRGAGDRPSANPGTSQRGGATVDARSTSLGKILTDSQGRTLYLFEKDTGPKSMCSGACASAWPPLTTNGKPKAGTGVTASMLGTTKRSDGSSEVTYNGHPLYLYAGDGAPGDTNGQVDQFGAEWYVVSPAGHEIGGTAASTQTGGDGGY